MPARVGLAVLSSRFGRDLAFAAGAALVVLAAVALVLRLWRADLRVPFEYSGDAHYMLMSVRAVLEGSLFVNSRLGAPFGQELYDFPFLNGDALNVGAIGALGLFSSDPALVMNVFFLLTFPAVALVAFFVFRALGVSRGAAFVCAALFALLPYHFLRGEPHLFLSAYYAVPLGGLLVLRVLGGEPLFGGRRTIATAAMCVVVATAGAYYAAFTLVLVAVATVLAFAMRRTRGALAGGAAVLALISLTLLVSFSPTLVYQVAHGVNEEVERSAWETEFYSLRLIQLVLPVSDHRLGPLAEAKERYESTVPATEASGATLGLVGACGLLWLLSVLLLSALGRGSWVPGALHRYAAVAALVAFLTATTGGVATVFAHFVTPWLHAWNRISVFIAFFALLAVGLLLDRLRSALTERRVHAAAWPALLGAVLVLGILDQTTSSFVRPYSALAAEYEGDAAFFARIERTLSPRAMVFQVPAVRFPELEKVGRTSSYDAARPYVHSDELRWSYGAVRGRGQDWATVTRHFPPQLRLPAIASAGFSGLLVDRRSFWRFGGSARVEGGARGLLGQEPLVSPSGRFAFYDLRAFAGDLEDRHPAAALRALREATLKPVRFEWGDDFPDLERLGKQRWRWALAPRARLTIVNPLSRERVVDLRAVVATATVSAANVWIRYPNGEVQRLLATGGGTQLERSLRLRAGDNVIELSTEAPPAPGDPRGVYLRVIDAAIVDEAWRPFHRDPVPIM